MSRDEWADYRSEDPDRGFKKTFMVIAIVHLVLLGGLLFATLFQSKKTIDTVVWMNPGSFGGGESATGDSQAASNQESVAAPSEQSRSENRPETPPETNQEEEEPQPTPPPVPPTPPPLAHQSERPLSPPSQ